MNMANLQLNPRPAVATLFIAALKQFQPVANVFPSLGQR
jgi:hypothetical protein